MTAISLKLLLVDDDPNLLDAFRRAFRKRFDFDTALGGEAALELIRTSGPYAVVLADMNMPGMNGVELLDQVRLVAPDTVRMMLTGNADQRTPVDAINRASVFRFLSKPCPPEELVPAIDSALKHHELIRAERELLEGTLTGSVKVLSEVLGLVAPDALGRGQRLRESMRQFAGWIHAEPLWELEVAALLSPIGMASVPGQLLRKAAAQSPLSGAESEVIRRTPQVGHDLVRDIPRLAGVAQIILYQNQKFDGTGFPYDGVIGDAIPRGARMLKILHDRLDLETEGIVKQDALAAMKAREGTYDPDLLEQNFACFGTFLANAITRDRPVRSLPASKLEPGQVAVSDIATLRGIPVLGSGNRLTPMIIARLRNFAEIGDLREPVLVQDGS